MGLGKAQGLYVFQVAIFPLDPAASWNVFSVADPFHCDDQAKRLVTMQKRLL
ncbi:hypothetical protein Q5427_12970 [Brochothrix thermosphacta]|uniref:hypothetical protein n=1 Tax=Brochothrix thermosphacta TaxID=2756 RepID=UPI002712F3B7|nr:hypothetical protein [Brochothrix thermosphacta]MDO7865195.1 hypothetical protein [Brochothrix thermosphacta]